MKKLIIVPLISIVALSCATHTTASTATKEGKKIVVAPNAGMTKITPEMLAQGQQIFENSCAKCHDLPQPAKHTDGEWVHLVNAMAPKSHLTAEQSALVFDYVTSKN